MAVTIKINTAALKVIADRITASIKRIGEAAEKIGNAADKITAATTSPKVRKARLSLASAGAVSFTALLARLFRGPSSRSD